MCSSICQVLHVCVILCYSVLVVDLNAVLFFNRAFLARFIFNRSETYLEKFKVKTNCTGLITLFAGGVSCGAQTTSWCSVQSAGSDLDLLCFVLVLVHGSSCTAPRARLLVHSSSSDKPTPQLLHGRHLVVGICNYRCDVRKLLLHLHFT